MPQHDAIEIRAMATLLRETLFRANPSYAFLLNPGDPGLVETLRSLSAPVASTPCGSGRKSIAAHANHVLYGIELANRALGGEPDVFENADWESAWTIQSVSQQHWEEIVNRLQQQSQLLIEQVGRPRQWDETLFTGAMAIAAHAAYHLGSIRQMLLASRSPADR